MGILKKRSPDIDFTLLQRRGIIRKPKDMKDVLDLTANSRASPLDAQVLQTQTAAASPFSFLDAPATSAASFFDNNSSAPSASSQSLGVVSAEKLAEIDNLKVQIENLEFKLERLLEKFDSISLKLTEFERKVT